MNKINRNRPAPPVDETTGPGASGERRKLGRIIHDERGAASLEWRAAPQDYERPVLRVEGTGVKAPEPLSIQEDDTFNPYNRSPDSSRRLTGKGGKRDLRKLSEWIKMMRELEERKKREKD